MKVFVAVRRFLVTPVRPMLWLWADLERWWDELFLTLITYWEGETGFRMRYRYHKRRLGSLGRGSRIDVGVKFEHPERIFIGDRVHLDRNCLLVAAPADLDLSHRDLKKVGFLDEGMEAGRLSIGDECHLSQGVMIFAHGGVRIGDLVTLSSGVRVYSLSSLADSPSSPGSWTSLQPYSGASPSILGPVALGRNVWLGLDVLVFPGVTVAEDSFVRSRSVVTRSCPANSFLAGDPARVIKHRFQGDNGGER